MQLCQQLRIDREAVQLDFPLLLGLTHRRQQSLLQAIIQGEGRQNVARTYRLSDDLALQGTAHIRCQQDRILGQLTRIQQGGGYGTDIGEADLLLEQLAENPQLLHLGQRRVELFRQAGGLGSQILSQLADLVMAKQRIELLP